MKGEKSGSVVDSPLPEPVTTPADSSKYRTKKIVKYSISFALVWFVVHSWFILPRKYIFVGRPSSHPSACAHGKYAWVTEAFAPKAPEIPLGRLAENFFLCVFRLAFMWQR